MNPERFQYVKPVPRQKTPEEQLVEQLGGFNNAFNAVDAARTGGKIAPTLAGRSPEELAQLDRYSQFGDVGENLGIIGYPSAMLGAIGYEYGMKNPLIGNLVSKLTGDDQYKIDKTTSPSSWGNVAAAHRGYLAGSRRR